MKSQFNGLLIERITRDIERQNPVEAQIRGLRSAPQDKEEQDKLGVELVDWATHPNSMYIEEFPLSKRINPYRFYRMRKTNEFFAECLQIAYYFCGLHLKLAVHKKEINYQYVLALLPLYNPEYKEYLVERTQKAIEAHIGTPVRFSLPWVEEIEKELRDERRNNSTGSVPPEGIPKEVS